MAWYMWALLGAVTWGIHYPLIGRVLQHVSPITVYFIPTILVLLGLPFYHKILIRDFQTLYVAPNDIKLMALTIAFTSVIASIAVYKAIHLSNATLASLIEITYPLFVALFAYFILKEVHLSITDLIGGALIIVGTGIIIWNAQ